MKPKQVVMDIECYKDYFLVMFVNSQGKSKYFEQYEGHPLDSEGIKTILSVAETVTFNGNGYDFPILTLAFSGVDCETLKGASDLIIQDGVRPWDFYKRFKLQQPSWDTIDLIEPAPAVKISLKLYGGRMHSKRLQDLPILHDSEISVDQRQVLIDYCRNDLQTTIDLLHAIEDRIELRRSMSQEYGIDLRSKSDAQIAEVIIKQEVEKLSGAKVKKPQHGKRNFNYQKPSIIKFGSPELNNILNFFENVTICSESNGTISFSEEPPTIKIGSTTYKLGMGGLHSNSDKECWHKEDAEYIVADWDFSSFYPNIILQLGLYPEALGTHFCTVFRGITEKRLEAKKTGNKLVDTSMKIAVNGTYGKLGSVYSILFAPHLLIQTTITGQLILLMLIEALEKYGIHVFSANTDGVVMKCHRSLEPTMKAIVASLEKHTGFSMEETRYSAIYNRDVNSYVAIKTNGAVKTKGFFATGGLSKSPTNEICSKAFIEYLTNGTPIEDTILASTDIRGFLSVRTVKGGAVKDDVYLGKAIRWYNAKGMKGAIHYKSNGNTVPRTEGAKPCMLLPEALPDDIDYDWYIREANDMLMDVGLVKRPKPSKIPRKNCKAWLELIDNGYLIQIGDEYVWYDEVSSSV